MPGSNGLMVFYGPGSGPNVVARNETGRLPLKLNILLRIIKFWIHLESLPENSIAKQCFKIISNQ